jgi:predicted chitinase
MITADRIKRLAPSARADLVKAIIDNWSYAEERGIKTPRRIRHFMSQICVETGGLRAIEENLKYSAKRLTQVWPSRFRTLAAAKPFANNPKALALKVYGGRNGNRPGTDDGWIYRGSGFMQNTGLSNFRLAGYQNDPEALRTPGPGFNAAVDYWAKHGLNRLADADNLDAIRKRINGGTHGIADARAYLRKGEKIWPDSTALRAVGDANDDDDKGAKSKEQVEYVQKRLRELGYYDVGEVDGEFGPRSRDALNAFKADNDLPLVSSLDAAENITNEAILALYDAKPRAVGESRANATAADLAPKSQTVLMAVRNKIASMASAIISFAVAAFYGVIEFFGDAYEKTEPFRNALAHIHPAVWFGIAGAIALVIWRMNAGVEKRVVEDYRKGKKL